MPDTEIYTLPIVRFAFKAKEALFDVREELLCFRQKDFSDLDFEFFQEQPLQGSRLDDRIDEVLHLGNNCARRQPFAGVVAVTGWHSKKYFMYYL